MRLLRTGQWSPPVPARDFKRVNGGLLVQDRDDGMVTRSDLKVVTERGPTDAEWDDLLFAWKVAKFVKSNALSYAAQQRQSVSVPDRCRGSTPPGSPPSKPNTRDSRYEAPSWPRRLLPFRDGIDNAAERGIAAVIQPGGSMRDEEVIAAANDAGMAMVFTGMRHFRH